MANLISKLSVTQLERAISIRQAIVRLEAELDDLVSEPSARRVGRPRLSVKVKAAAVPGKRKRTMSPEARERIATAQKARWAKLKAAK